LSTSVYVILDRLVCRTKTWGEINTNLVASGLRQQRKQMKVNKIYKAF